MWDSLGSTSSSRDVVAGDRKYESRSGKVKFFGLDLPVGVRAGRVVTGGVHPSGLIVSLDVTRHAGGREFRMRLERTFKHDITTKPAETLEAATLQRAAWVNDEKNTHGDGALKVSNRTWLNSKAQEVACEYFWAVKNGAGSSSASSSSF